MWSLSLPGMTANRQLTILPCSDVRRHSTYRPCRREADGCVSLTRSPLRLYQYLPCLFHHGGKRSAALLHHFPRHFELFQFLLAGQVEHQIEHEFFQNHAQPPRSHLACHRLTRNRPQSLVAKLQPHVFELKQPLVLLDDVILRPGQDFDERELVQIFQHAHHRQAAHKFRNQPDLDQVFRLDLGQQFLGTLLGSNRVVLFGLFATAETERLLAHSAGDDLVEPDEGSAADEEDVGRVHWSEFLVRVLAPALRRNIGDCAFQNLQQRLLHAFARNVACDRRILILPPDLVDFIDVDDARLGAAHVPVRRLQQLEDDVLDIFADVAGFGERGGIDDGEGYIQHAGQSLRQKRLTRAGRADQHDIRLAQLDPVAGFLPVHEDALVVVVDRDRQLLLGLLLPDYVFIEEGLHFRSEERRVG